MTCLELYYLHDLDIKKTHCLSHPGPSRSDRSHPAKDIPQEGYHGQTYIPSTFYNNTGMYKLIDPCGFCWKNSSKV